MGRESGLGGELVPTGGSRRTAGRYEVDNDARLPQGLNLPPKEGVSLGRELWKEYTDAPDFSHNLPPSKHT